MTRTLYSGVTTPAASVTVYWAGTTTKPPIYVSATGTTKANPVTADWGGAYSFWIDDGHYKIVNGSTAGDLNDVRVSSTPEAKPSADQIAVLPFLGSTATTQQALNESLLAGTLPMVGGTFSGTLTATGGDLVLVTANGATMTIGSVSENITLNTGGTTTYGTTDLVPAYSSFLGAVARVTTTITTATDWTISLDADTTVLANTNSTMTAGTQSVKVVFEAGGGNTPDRFKIVTTGTPGAGAIRVTLFYLSYTAPTS